MNKGNLVIYDAEYEFASRLAAFLSSRHDNVFNIYAFTDYSALKEFAQNCHVDILLVSENVLNQNINDLGAGEVVVLSDSDRQNQLCGYKTIEKYQSADGVFREVMEYAMHCNEKSSGINILLQESKVAAVYSPVHRCGKTIFSLTLSHILSSENRVLYLNFEEYSGFRSLFNAEYVGDLSDLVYFYMQNKDILQRKLCAIKKEYCGFDYIPPMMFSNDIRNVPMDVWTSFVNEIKLIGGYDVIVLDLSDMLIDIFEMLDICDVIYMPAAEDFISSAKIDEFYQVLSDRHREEMSGRIRKVYIKGEDYIEQSNCDVSKIVTGGFSRYIRNMIGGMQV